MLIVIKPDLSHVVYLLYCLFSEWLMRMPGLGKRVG